VVPDPQQAATRDYAPGHATGQSSGRAGVSEDEALAFLAPPTRPDALGRIGHYEVLQVLGRGAFGIVFRAFDEVLQRVVAVKVLAPQLATTSPARKRFLREARSSAAIRHENVVQVYEVGEQPLPYLVIEFIPGETLQQRLDRMGPLDVPETLRIGRQIAEGLAAAHATDLIHRDIKPGNILLEAGQQKVKITDFGLARAADDASISQSGIIAGTPMYMAPEQAQGQALDQRADLFSLGSVLYQMVTGRPPFRASTTMAVLKRVAEDTPRPIREIIPETPPWLCDIIAKLHAKKPEDRFSSAREVADLLADCEAQLQKNAKLQDFSRIPRSKPHRSRPREWAVVAAVLVPVIVLFGLKFAGVFPREHPAQDTINSHGGQETPAADGWVQLFNGKDLSGWRATEGQQKWWAVRNGILQGRGGLAGMELHSTQEFEHFHLRTQVRISDGGYAGLGFGGHRGWVSINSTSNFPTHSHTGSLTLTGKDKDIRGKDPLVPAGTWFQLELIVLRDQVVVGVNGKETLSYINAEQIARRGSLWIMLTDEPKTLVEFRSIEIRELPADSPKIAIKELPPRVSSARTSDPALIKALGEVVSAKERSLKHAQEQFAAGQMSRLQVIAVEVDLVEARIRLTETEHNKPGMIGHLEALVKLRQEERAQTVLRVQAGHILADEIAKVDALLAEAKARLVASSETVPK
jgi:serine/threonine protein kinase